MAAVDNNASVRVSTAGDGVTVVEVLDPAAVNSGDGPLYDLADRVAAGHGSKKVILDLSRVNAINSAAIGVLLNVQKRLAAGRATLRLCCVDPYVLNIFHLTRVDQVFRIDANRETAIQAFDGSTPRPSGKAGATPAPPADENASWLTRIFGKG